MPVGWLGEIPVALGEQAGNDQRGKRQQADKGLFGVIAHGFDLPGALGTERPAVKRGPPRFRWVL